MRRQTLPIVAVSVLVLASALFMGWAALRTTQPLATPTLAPPSAVVTTALMAEQSQSGGGSLDLGLLTLELPADWRHQIDAWPTEAPAELADATPLLAAWQGAARFNDAPLRFTVFTVERNELSLERYAGDVAEQLAAADGVSDIQTILDATFRSDTLPVAYLRYTKEFAFGRQFGYQVAAFDAHGDHIVIATLVTQSNGDEEILRSLVRSMRFTDMPAVPQEGA